MSYCVDLNSDIAEGFGVYKIGLDEEIIKCVTSINIACGWHAGDPLIMNKTVELAKKYNVAIGAHPGFPDLIGFGRRKLAVSPEEAKAYMLYQVGALSAFAKFHGVKIQHMKLHGAFYNMAADDPKLANAVLDGMENLDKDIIIMILSGSFMAKEAKRRGFKVAEEVFADRGYNADGTLVNRNLPGAFVKDPNQAIERVIKMIKEKKVIAVDGTEIDINADSICVHGDNSEAIEFVNKIKSSLLNNGIEVKSLDKFIK